MTVFLMCVCVCVAVWLATQNHSTLVTETTVVPFLPVNPEYSSTRNQACLFETRAKTQHQTCLFETHAQTQRFSLLTLCSLVLKMYSHLFGFKYLYTVYFSCISH